MPASSIDRGAEKKLEVPIGRQHVVHMSVYTHGTLHLHEVHPTFT